MKAIKLYFGVLGFIAALSASNVMASYTYTFTGDAFAKLTNCSSCSFNYTSANHLEVSITTLNPIDSNGLFGVKIVNGVDTTGQGVVGFSMTDGSQNTFANSYTDSESILTVRAYDTTGVIEYWDISTVNYIKDGSTGNIIASQSMYTTIVAGDIASFKFGTGFDITEGRNYGGGTWASPAIVPVPAAAWLLGSGLVGLIGFARRRVL